MRSSSDKNAENLKTRILCSKMFSWKS